MGTLMKAIKDYFSKNKEPASWPRTSPSSFSRGSRQTKMLIREAIRNCVKLGDSGFTSRKDAQAMFFCVECEKVIAHLDFSRISTDWREHTVDIMMAAKLEDFKCPSCGSYTYALAGPK